MKHAFYLIFALGLSSEIAHGTLPQKIKGMRVNPSYLYRLVKTKNKKHLAKASAQKVVQDAKLAGVNTLFIQAYNPTFGAFYPTTYAHTEVEPGLGNQDFMGELLQTAHQNQM